MPKLPHALPPCGRHDGHSGAKPYVADPEGSIRPLPKRSHPAEGRLTQLYWRQLMNPMNLLRISLVLAVTALAAILPGISSRAGHVGAASIGPTLTSAHQLTVVPGRVAVTGNGFTPG